MKYIVYFSIGTKLITELDLKKTKKRFFFHLYFHKNLQITNKKFQLNKTFVDEINKKYYSLICSEIRTVTLSIKAIIRSIFGFKLCIIKETKQMVEVQLIIFKLI